MDKIYKTGSWRHSSHCIECDGELSDYQKYNSHGRCPLCGYKSPSACTIVEIYEKPYRNLYMKPLWMFWQTPIREYKY